MTNIKAPCMGCKDRYVGCHGNCQAYLDYDAKNKQINAKKLERRVAENVFNDCLCKTTRGKLFLGW